MAMKGPPRLPVRYSSPKEHWLAPVEAAAEGFIAPALMKVVLPSRPLLALDSMLDSVTYLSKKQGLSHA